MALTSAGLPRTKLAPSLTPSPNPVDCTEYILGLATSHIPHYHLPSPSLHPLSPDTWVTAGSPSFALVPLWSIPQMGTRGRLWIQICSDLGGFPLTVRRQRVLYWCPGPRGHPASCSPFKPRGPSWLRCKPRAPSHLSFGRPFHLLRSSPVSAELCLHHSLLLSLRYFFQTKWDPHLTLMIGDQIPNIKSSNVKSQTITLSEETMKNALKI